MELKEAKQRFFNQLGQWKIMALGSSVNDYVMVRNVSCLFYNEKICFKIRGLRCAAAGFRWRGLLSTKAW